MIKDNLENILKTLPASCTLVAVSKTHPVEVVLEAYQAGQRAFGENKVQDLVAKQEALPKDIQWHLIGHLQTNKVKYVAPFVHLIHSVDSLKLLEEISKQAAKHARVVSCLLQLHIASEETKFGFSPEEVKALIHSGSIEKLANIHIAGLMGMASFTDNPDHVRSEFKSLKILFDELKTQHLPSNVSMKELSMGMSGDYRLAVEEGSTIVRVGSSIFGQRNYSV